MSIVLLTLTGLLVLVAVALYAAMLRRDEPLLGMVAMVLLVAAGLVGSAYAGLAAAG